MTESYFSEDADGEYDGDGWCVECGDEFHLDDCGGYNPPCACGFHCRSCHEAIEGARDPDDYERDEDSYPDGGARVMSSLTRTTFLPRESPKRKAVRLASGRTAYSTIVGKPKPVKKRNVKRAKATFARCFHSVERVEWIKSLPCCVSGVRGDIENVHVRGDGAARRAGFAWIVPMARELHRVLHRLGIRSFQERYTVDLYAKACNTAQAWEELTVGASPRTRTKT